MSVEKDLVDHLLAAAGVSAIVGTEIYFGRVYEYTYPMILIRHSGGSTDPTLGGEGSLRNPEFQIDVFAKQAIDASLLCEAVRAGLAGASTFSAQAITAPAETIEEDQDAVRLTFEISVWHFP